MNKSEQIQAYIMEKVRSKEYEAGKKLPTEAELIEIFGVSRMTVNKALGILRHKGYIYSQRGKGTFVQKNVMRKKLNELTSFTEEMACRGVNPVTRVLEFSYTSMGYENEKKDLEIGIADNIYKLVRVRYIEDLPIALDITILSPSVTGEIEHSKIKASLYVFLQKDLGIIIDYSVQKIRAVKADAFVATQLEINIGDPVLHIKSVTYDIDNRPFEVVHTYYVHDAYEFEQISTRNKN